MPKLHWEDFTAGQVAEYGPQTVTAEDIKAFAETVGSLAGDSGAGTSGGLVTNSAGSATLTIGSDNTNTTFVGVITAATPANLLLTKIGTGNQTLTGVNTYTGGTTLSNFGARSGPSGTAWILLK